MSGTKSLFFLSLSLSLAVVSTRSIAHVATRKTDFPCAGCVTSFPDSPDAGASPLLVVLHGDGSTAKSILGPWEAAATKRGIVVFAPKCPVDDGCPNASWWQWGKDPAWFDGNVAKISAVRAIDPKRTWAAGWSGGASYLGYRAPDLVGRFAAIGIDGGGMVPRDPQECANACALDSYFLVGDKNPLHALTKDLRDWLDRCHEGDVAWDLLPGADHAGEWLALNKPAKIEAMLDWFEARKLSCAPAPAPSTSATSATTPTIADDDAGTTNDANDSNTFDTTSAPEAPSAAPIPTTRCACEMPGNPVQTPWPIAWLVLAWMTTRFSRVARGKKFFIVACAIALCACKRDERPSADPDDRPRKPATAATVVYEDPMITTSPDGKQIPAPSDVANPPSDAIVSPTGLASKVLRKGTGSVHPGPMDRIVANYTGWTRDGKMFDSSITRGQPIRLGLNMVIRGWTEGLQLMVVGEQRRFWIPGKLGYGDTPIAGRPTGMIVFDVELLDVTPIDAGVSPAAP